MTQLGQASAIFSLSMKTLWPRLRVLVPLVVLAVAIFARYVRHLVGAWRWIYVVTALLAFYLNVFVGVVQAFQKVSFLNVLAPTQSEPPFLFTQLVVLILFLALTIVAAIRFRAESVHAA